MTSFDTAPGQFELSTLTPPPVWELLIAETKTGAVVRELPVVPGTVPSWSRGVNSRGQLSAQVLLYSDMLALSELRELITGGDRYSLAWCAGTWVAQAGPVQKFTPTITPKLVDSYLTIECSGIWALCDTRPVAPAATTNWVATAADTTIGPWSWRTVVKRLLEQMETWTDNELPLVYEADVAGTNSITYYGYDIGMVGERIHEISQRQDGCDIEFAPRLSGDRKTLEFVVRTGTPYLGQSGSLHVWTSGSDLITVTPVVDYVPAATDWLVPGQGTERGRIIGAAENTAMRVAGAPRRWRVAAEHGSVTELATLTSYASAYAEMYGAPIENWTAVVDILGDGPELSAVAPGDDGLFVIKGNPWLPDGDYRRRVIDIGNGGTRDQVALTLAPVPARF
jgi:hypothetical protein